MANACYFHRLLSIIQSPQGRPLLAELQASVPAICELLTMRPDTMHQAVRPAVHQCLSGQIFGSAALPGR